MRLVGFIVPLLALLVSQVSSAPIGQLEPRDGNSIPGIGHAFPGHHSNLFIRSEPPPPIHIGRLVYRRDGWIPLEARTNFGSEKSQRTTHTALEKRESIGEKIRNAFRNFGNKIKQGFQKFGQKVREGFHKVKAAFHHIGHKIKEGFHKVGKFFHHVGHKIKEGFHKVGKFFHHVGHKIKDGFIKAGHWIKENAAKVGKFALKAVSAVASIAGRVISFIPIIGKAAGKALQLAAKGISHGADRIKANLGDKLEKGMKVMSAIVNPGSAIANAVKGKGGKALGAMMEILTKREFDPNYLVERDLQGEAKLFIRDYA